LDWTRAIDGYCERLGPQYWAEPINAVTNAGFVLVALFLWPRVRGVDRVLVVILGVIGIGSYLFHTHGQVWAALADVAPIGAFVLVYIFVANRDYWGMRPGWAFGATVLFFPYAALMVPVFEWLRLGSSSAYAPVALMIAGYAVALRRRLPEVARGLGIGAALLALSITFRALDEPLCSVIPFGTHFLWHLLNAAMLGWMICVHARHALAGRGVGR
jgi:hypothetical protein